jgi:hypothetical protein
MLAAVSCTKLNEVKREAALFDCIGIDEGQFVRRRPFMFSDFGALLRLTWLLLLLLQLQLQFADIVPFCELMASLGKIVIVAALDGTFQRKVSRLRTSPLSHLLYLLF